MGFPLRFFTMDLSCGLFKMINHPTHGPEHRAVKGSPKKYHLRLSSSNGKTYFRSNK